MRLRQSSIPLALLLSAVVWGQCPPTPPAGFANDTSITGNELNLISNLDSTANSLFTPTGQDNIAIASAVDPISLNLSNVAGTAGSPVSILYAVGAPSQFPQTLPGSGTVWLDFANPFGPIVDGIGLFSVYGPNPFLAHPGPQYLFNLQVGLANLPGINNTCWTLQAALLDPSSYNSIRLSNAVQLEVRPGIQSISPNFSPEYGAVTVTTSGGSGGTLNFGAFAPAGTFGATTLSANSASLTFATPLGSGSGGVTFEDASAPGYPSTYDPEDMRTFVAVINPNGPSTVTGTTNTLSLVTSPFTPTDKWATVINSLANAAAVHTYTVALNAGDLITVEAYSMNVLRTQLLDGLGRTYNPGATEGNDILMNLTEVSNGLPLTFDQGATGPFLLQIDDDSGPGNNPRMVFQARATDSYQILLGSSNAPAFATGDYLLNVHVITNAPSVSRFQTAGVQINAKAAGTAVDIIGNNFPLNPCTITLAPIHGLYAPVTVVATPTNATTLTFTLPALSASIPRFLVGGHYVTVTDNISGRTSLIWDNTNVGQQFGILPEVFFVKSATTAAVTAYPTAITSNTQTYAAQGSAANPAAFIAGLTVNPGQNVYIEVLGTRYGTGTAQYALVDTATETGNTANGIYNPTLTVYGSGLATIVAQNDDDGFTPFPYFWPYNGSPGIGFNAAVLLNEGGYAVAGFPWAIYVQQPVAFLAVGSGRAYIMNVVVL